MFCQQCGSWKRKDYHFCPKCGTATEKNSTSSGSALKSVTSLKSFMSKKSKERQASFKSKKSKMEEQVTIQYQLVLAQVHTELSRPLEENPFH